MQPTLDHSSATNPPSAPPPGAGRIAAPRIPFVVRVGAFAIGMVLLSMAITTWLAYRSNKDALEQALGAELLAIAKTVAVQLHGDMLPLIDAGFDGEIEGADEFEFYRRQLLLAKSVHNLTSDGSPLYIMRPAIGFEQHHQLEFVVMTDRNESGAFFVGNRYPAEPHNLKALNGEAVATRVYSDDHGAWISACAPIHDRAGEVVAILQVDRTVDFFFEKAREQARPLLFGALAGVLLASLAAWPFARSLAQPVHRLTAATREFAAGRLDHRVELNRKDELGELGHSFNAMASDLDSARAQMGKQQEALQRSLKEVKAAGRAKDQFLATMSHEVRTPMNAILGFNQLLRDTELTPEQREYVETVSLSADGLMVLLNDMLDFAKIESETVSFEERSFTLVDTLRRTLRFVNPDAQAKGLSLESSFDPRLPGRLHGDPDRIRQVVLNLLTNAVKFTGTGTVLLRADLVSSEDDEVAISISVTDTGIGIDPADHDRLFQPFTQVDESSTRSYGGIGLGLAIAHRLVQLMQGELTVESRVGEGSTFRFTARLRRVPDSITPEAPSDPAPPPAAELIAPPPAKPRPVEATPDPSDQRVLLVEDNKVNQKLALRVLKKAGYAAALAENGEEAVKQHTAAPFDLILMDLQMPVMDGLEATRRIREWEVAGQRNRVPIVAVTANAMPGDDERCYAAGVDHYVTKPFNAGKFASALQHVWGGETAG